jgi:hypothetical protein
MTRALMKQAPVHADEIAELERVSVAQRDAVRAGDLEELRLLLGTRQRLLDGMRGRAVRPGDLEPAKAAAAQTVAALHAEVLRVEAALSHLDAGSRALLGYAVKAATPAGYLDHVR